MAPVLIQGCEDGGAGVPSLATGFLRRGQHGHGMQSSIPALELGGKSIRVPGGSTQPWGS